MAEATKDRHRNPSYRSALASITELQSQKEEYKMEPLPMLEPVDTEEFSKLSNVDKMEKLVSKFNLLCEKTKQIDIGINDDNTGLATVLSTVQAQVDQATTDVTELKWENALLKGIVQRQSKQIESLSNRVTKLVAKSMDKNIIISGILRDEKKEDCKVSVVQFLTEVMEIEVGDDEILIAHRKGIKREQDRAMLVRCQYPLKE